MVVVVECGSADRDALVANIVARNLPSLISSKKRWIQGCDKGWQAGLGRAEF
jgi:hypothetical protein